ncbi:COG4-domain-containing protein [Fistulina hepatica ATCC 64428]|nr:COG4-domain-containing protein [Fistulina hepatica ATCC 64428]
MSISEDAADSGRRDPRELTSLSEILSCLSVFQAEEAELSTSLTKLLSSREPIASSMHRLELLLSSLDSLHGEATKLSGRVSSTAHTAERISGRVRSFDEEMRRIREASDRVSQVMELKSSLIETQASIENQDWESATRHCARAMSLPLDVISGPFAEMAVPTPEIHLPPAQTLQAAREHLLDVFRRNFEVASSARDSAATTRFFKLFPAIGWEAEGLQAYAAFVTDLVRVRAPASAKTSSPLYYVTSLTVLFECVAMIVDQHQPVVEKYYGPGKMKKVVERLLEECGRIVKGLVEGWEEERSMKRKLSDVKRYPPAPLFSSTMCETEDAIDPRDIDKVVLEGAGMAGRWNVFRKFLAQSLQEDNDTASRLEEELLSEEKFATGDSPTFPGNQEYFISLLDTYYMPLETWYVRTIINKAHRLSTPDESQSPPITTTPDDVFYILKVVLMRLISTGSLPTVDRMLGQLREIVERDYGGIVRRKLDDVYRNSNGITERSALAREKVERENRTAFIILLNDLDVSASHMEQLTSGIAENPLIAQHFILKDQEAVKASIASFGDLALKFRVTLQAGIEQLFNQLVRPKLRTFVSDIYKDVTYVLDDDAYASAEYQDVVRKRFIKSWEALVEGYKDVFTDVNYRTFFGLTLDLLIRPWERFVLSFKFTELGAIRFDRDLRSITNYLASQTTFGDVREKFVRFQQISTLLNLDNEEDVDDFYNSSGITWKLSAQEARSIAALKM